MDVLAAIGARVTAGRLAEPGPDAAALTRILQAGVQAPDHGRLAPWRFVVLRGDARGVLGAAMAALRRAGDPAISEAALAAERDKAFRAPVVVVVAAEVVAGHRIPEIEQIMAVAACVQNMLLASLGLGFAANWKTGPAAYDAGVKAALGLAAEAAIVGIVYIGTPVGAPAPRQSELAGFVREI
jgi:nitroreductase